MSQRAETASPQAGFQVSRRFIGQVFDAESGLYYYNARYYDPELGRFIQADDIIPDLANPQSYNRYSYVMNNPLRYTDPTGHEEVLSAASGRAMLQAEDSSASRVVQSAHESARTMSTVMKTVVAVTPAGTAIGIGEVLTGEQGYGSGEKLNWKQRTASGVLAGIPGVIKIGGKALKAGEEAAVATKVINLPGWKKLTVDMEHIASGHMASGSRVSSKKTLFNSSWSQSTVESAIKEAYESAKKIETQGDRVRLHGTGSGQKIEMWLNTKSKTIETAYPIKWIFREFHGYSSRFI